MHPCVSYRISHTVCHIKYYKHNFPEAGKNHGIRKTFCIIEHCTPMQAAYCILDAEHTNMHEYYSVSGRNESVRSRLFDWINIQEISINCFTFLSSYKTQSPESTATKKRQQQPQQLWYAIKYTQCTSTWFQFAASFFPSPFVRIHL